MARGPRLAAQRRVLDGLLGGPGFGPVVQRQLQAEDERQFRSWAAGFIGDQLDAMKPSEKERDNPGVFAEYKRTIGKGMEAKAELIVAHAVSLDDAQERLASGRVMGRDEHEAFLRWLQEERKEVANDQLVLEAGLTSPTLEAAKKKVATILLFNQSFKPLVTTKAVPVDKRPSLGHWATDKPLKEVTLPAVQMNEARTVTDSDARYVLWSGGAADCIVVAAHAKGKAFLWHATALHIIENPKELAQMLESQIGKGAVVHLSSQKLNLPDVKQKVSQAITEGGFTLRNVFETTSLALNARTGEVSESFNFNEF